MSRIYFSTVYLIPALFFGTIEFSLSGQVDGLNSVSPTEAEMPSGIDSVEADDLGALDDSKPVDKSPSEVVPPQPVIRGESPESVTPNPVETPTPPEDVLKRAIPGEAGQGEGTLQLDSGEVVSPSETEPVGESVDAEDVNLSDPSTSANLGSGQSPSDSNTENTTESSVKKKKVKKTSIVGAYRVHLGAAGVEFKESALYKEHYDSESFMPSFKVDYFFFDWYATLGVSFQAGMYKDKGYSLDGNGNKVLSEPLELSLIPLQVAGVLAISPFTQKWISLSGWTGIEYVRFSEIRPDSKDQNDRVRNLKGTRTAAVAGGALHLRIDFLDEASAASMNVLNLHHIYISPYMQMISRTSAEDKIHFSRSEMGIFFSFESL